MGIYMALFILTVTGLSGLLVLNGIYKHTRHYQYYYGNFINGVKKLPDNLDVLAVGSAQAYYGYEFSKEPVKAGNLSGNPQSLGSCSLMLMEYLHKLREGGAVIFTPPLCIFFFDEYNTDQEYIKYYGVLHNRRMIKGYKWYKTIRYKMLPVLIHKKNVIRFLRDLEYKSDRDHWQTPTKELFIQMTEKRFEDWKALAGVDVEHNRIDARAELVKQKNRELLLNTIRRAREQGARVYFVIPPFTDLFNSRISKEFIHQEYESLLQELAELTGSRLLNYREDTRFVSHYEYFRNADCLNPLGARMFTHIVLNEVTDCDSDQ